MFQATVYNMINGRWKPNGCDYKWNTKDIQKVIDEVASWDDDYPKYEDHDVKIVIVDEEGEEVYTREISFSVAEDLQTQ